MSAVVQLTVTGTSEAAERVTTNASGAWPVLPSLRLAAGAVEGGGSVWVVVPVALPMVGADFSELLTFTEKVSFGSRTRSPLIGTRMLPVVWPAGIVSVPEVAW